MMKTAINYSLLENMVLGVESGRPYYYYLEDKFIQVTDLSKSAVLRFGKDPKFFKTELNRYKRYSVDCLKNVLILSKSSLLRHELGFCISSLISIYLHRIIAILQVDFECPGFINNFPEAIEYKMMLDDYSVNRFLNKLQERLEKIVNGFNRYSEQFDIKYLTSAFNIKKKDLEARKNKYETIRADDWVAIHFKELLKSSDSKQKEYLKTNFSLNKELVPLDYKEIISKILDESEFKKLKYTDDSLNWVDYYFDNQDNLITKIKYEELSPTTVKMINFTLI